VEDFTLRGANTDGSDAGYGIAVDTGAHGSFRRIALAGVRGDTILASGAETDVLFEDLAIADGGEQADGLYGRAIEAQYGARLVANRVRVERATEIGAFVTGDGTEVSLTMAALLDTRERACAETACPSAPGGIAVGVTGSGRATLGSFVVSGAPLCGVQVANGAELDLADGVVRGASIGACVQVPGFDLARITDDVVYEDNDINVDTTDHAVPQPAELDVGL
jgi:hypothetical protein